MTAPAPRSSAAPTWPGRHPLADGGTRLPLQFDMTPRSRLFRPAFPLVGPLIRRRVRATVDHLGVLLGQEVAARSRHRDGGGASD